MQNNKITKAADVTLAADGSTPSAEELRLIHAYTRRALSADEVYVFSVTLCDNDVDRDGERFTTESLKSLEKLFVGKTGIFDHNPSAKNQTARIFSCAVERVPSRKTAAGDDYFRLKARAYLPRTEGNAELIAALDSGIVKEVSVGCAVGKVLCSVCGEELRSCPHRKGETYGGKLCFGELCEPYDAYEWSFVAVPAQRQAGVTKSAYERPRLCEAARLYRQPQGQRGGRCLLPRHAHRRGAAPFGGGSARYFEGNHGKHHKGHDDGAAQRVQNRV